MCLQYDKINSFHFKNVSSQEESINARNKCNNIVETLTYTNCYS